jgi:MbtH protein
MNSSTLVLAGVVALALVLTLWFVIRRTPPAKVDSAWAGLAREELFVETSAETRRDLLADWRWKVGNDAQVFRVSVFGDLFTTTPEGRIYWLDTGRGSYLEIAADADDWSGQLADPRAQEWFHWPTLQALRSAGIELKEGQVFSWIQSPLLGGNESVDNVHFLSLEVHVSNHGRLAEALKDVPPGTRITNIQWTPLGAEKPSAEPTAEPTADSTIYEVVINEEEQYSIWPVGQAIPTGWKAVGKQGTRQECLDYLAEVWTDMRPLSLRKELPASE